ncbi:hypothetical protein WJ97_14600 [Burkholderia ubonensis]|uniref:hypothetical protein n=1 Tax=Burkholderia ubonensis TaxID=101571 RepID=UPI000752EE62|nr:hypothetical protein [Burkholderia ubonensis]KVP97045.1 hypothetical protein WJ97_14600 [Burkholderia ubonensis]
MNNEFRQAIAVLKQTNEDFKNGHTSSVAHANSREAALMAALPALARTFGVKLASMHRIDARGELHIVARDGDKDPRLGGGRFGGPFATLLNTANPRTGIAPGAVLDSESGWCYMNHFDVEKLVLRYFDENK